MFAQNDSGQFPEPGFAPDWQGHPAPARYPGQAQAPRLSRGEVWELYRFTVASLQENLRRRDRTHWFFATFSFAFFTAFLVLVVVFWEQELATTMLSLAALLLGAPVCLAWRWGLKCGSDLHEKNLKTVRKIEQEFHLPPLPFTVDEPPLSTFGIKQAAKDEESSLLFSRWDSFLPNAALALFLVLFVFVWREELTSAANWLWEACLGVWDWISPSPASRGR